MSERYASIDGHWTVTPVSIDGRQRLRIEHDSPYFDGHVVIHEEATGRQAGPVSTRPGWFLMADVVSVERVAAYVPLDQLVAEAGHVSP